MANQEEKDQTEILPLSLSFFTLLISIQTSLKVGEQNVGKKWKLFQKYKLTIWNSIGNSTHADLM